jgi:hypothetical protein
LSLYHGKFIHSRFFKPLTLVLSTLYFILPKEIQHPEWQKNGSVEPLSETS